DGRPRAAGEAAEAVAQDPGCAGGEREEDTHEPEATATLASLSAEVTAAGARGRRSRLRLDWLRNEGIPVAVVGLYAMTVLLRLPRQLNQDGWFALVTGREVAR